MPGAGDERGGADDDGRVLHKDAVGVALVAGQDGDIAAAVLQGLDVAAVLLAGQGQVNLAKVLGACNRKRKCLLKVVWIYTKKKRTLVEYQQSRDCATTVQRARAKLWILLEFLPRDALA